MCPDRKLKWFSDRGHNTQKIHERVLARFKESYSGAALDSTHISQSQQVRSIKVNSFSSARIILLTNNSHSSRQVICGLSDTHRLRKARRLVLR